MGLDTTSGQSYRGEAPSEAPPDELEVDPARPETLYAAMSELLGELADWVERRYRRDSAVWRCSDFTGGSMLEYKGTVGDGRLADWWEDDVRSYLLEWFPRTVAAPRDVLAHVPACAIVFLQFLVDRGSLPRSRLQGLERLLVTSREAFMRACEDRRNWSAAKRRVVDAVEAADCSESAAGRVMARRR